MSVFRLWSPPPPAFEYTPLDPSERVFRLIRLLPPRPSRLPGAHGTVRIELLAAHVDSVTPYDALSYAWNVAKQPSPPDRRIIVETAHGPRKLRIYRSLELALLNLVASHVSRPIFVDQICINQCDDAEKSHQVKLMRDIYTNCTRAVVWLGPSTRQSDRYFDFVQEVAHHGVLSRLMTRPVEQFLNVFDAVMDPSFTVNQQERQDRDDVLDLIREFGPRYPLDGLADVLDRRWFNRLWVIQEACLAPLVTFICGGKTLCFDCFRSGPLFYNLYNTHWVRNLDAPTPQRELRRRSAIFDKTGGLRRIFQERKAIHTVGRRQGLYDLVLKYNVNDDQAKIGASLEEDRIFGLLGLAAADDDLVRRVRVRYEKQVPRVYAEVAALLLEESIDTLLFSQGPKQTPGLPSWVPDWSMNLTIPAGYSDAKTPIFAAGGPKDAARFALDDASLRLTIRGVFVDTVARVGQAAYLADPAPQIMEQIDYRTAKRFFDEVADFVGEEERALRLCDAGLSQHYFTTKLGPSAGLEQLRALHDGISTLGQRLIRRDETLDTYKLSRIYQNAYAHPLPLRAWIANAAKLLVGSIKIVFAAYLSTFRRRWGKLNLKPAAADVERCGLDANVALHPDMGVFTGNLLKNRRRRLYSTEEGHVGIGPAGMEVGDCVVVFHGGTTAHVVRRRGGLCEYLGEAYCDLMMHGQALEDASREEDFLLI